MESAAAGRRDSRWDQRSTLEQKVGRQRTSGGLTLAEQIERGEATDPDRLYLAVSAGRSTLARYH